MTRRSPWIVWTALVAGAVACSTSPSGGGTGTPTEDVASTDVSTADAAVDATATDAADATATDVAMDRATPDSATSDAARDTSATDTGPRDAGPPYDPCSMASVVDLNARGMAMGTTTRITSNNNAVGAMAPLRSPCVSSVGHEVVFRYTPRAATRLRISTNNMGTADMFDTVVWAQSACSAIPADAGTTGSLGCNDDASAMPRNLASTFTTAAPVTAGTPIYIVVAGYTASATAAAQGTFELSVTELTTVPAGMACDATGATNVCAMGSTCITSGTTSTCVADGGRGGRCRTGMGATPCDAMLTCSLGTCLPTATAGMPCGSSVAVCAMGTSCVTASMMSTCVADGTRGGRCRTAMGSMPCDAMLTCSLGTCQNTIAVGMPCGAGLGACATGSTCAGPSGSQRCVADGAAGGACRTAMGSMPCDAMLTCTAGTCFRTVAAGAACDVTDTTARCAMGTSCAPMGTGATCQMNGSAAGTNCAAMPLCATGLTCDGDTAANVCRRAGTAGMACNQQFNSVACPMGTACLATSATAATCTATRAETEPNNTPAMPQAAVSTGTAYSGTVGMGTDTADCFAVTVPAMGGLNVETASPGDPGCADNDTVVTIYNAMGTQVARNDDGPRRGLCSFATARGLAAGTYSVCVEGFDAAATYTVSIGVFGP